MKLIGRMLIILLAVAIVAGVSYAIVNASSAGQPGSFGSEDFRPNGDFNGQGLNPGQRPEGFGARDGFRGGRGERGGIFDIGSLLRTLLPIALIVTVFMLGERLIEKLRLHRMAKN